MTTVNPRLLYVDNGIKIKGLKIQMDKLRNSISILSTRPHHETTEQQARLDEMETTLELRRSLQLELSKGYERYAEKFGHLWQINPTFDALDTVRPDASDSGDEDREGSPDRGSEVDESETQTDSK